MPPKNVKGRTLAEPSFAQSTYQYFTSKENRSVVTAVGMFAVCLPFIYTRQGLRIVAACESDVGMGDNE